jgi:hypothetical protein
MSLWGIVMSLWGIVMSLLGYCDVIMGYCDVTPSMFHPPRHLLNVNLEAHFEVEISR